MGGGLAFLSKKSWHTKNISNQEKVWIAEQQKNAEDLKTTELAKQIKAEREQDEFNRISNRKGNGTDRGIDWMYQEGGGKKEQDIEKEKKSEDFLLGKAITADVFQSNDVNEEEDGVGIGGVMPQLAVSSSSITNQKVEEEEEKDHEASRALDRNEEFRIRHEDPMHLVSLKHKERKNDMEKKIDLFKRAGISASETRKTSKSKRRDRNFDDRRVKREHETKYLKKKKKVKHESRDRRDRHIKSKAKYSSDSQSDSSRSQSYNRRKEYYRQDDDNDRERSLPTRKNDDSQSHQYREHSRSRHDKISRNRRSKHRYYEANDKISRKKSSKRSRSRSPNLEIDNVRERSSSRQLDHRLHEKVNMESIKSYASNEAHMRNESSIATSTRYGLQTDNTGHSLTNSQDLGPDINLLQKKRQAEKNAFNQRKNRQNCNANGGRHRMSSNEREQALREMKSDASRRDGMLLNNNNAQRKYDRDYGENLDFALSAKGSGERESDPSFLRELSSRHHGVMGESDMASRVSSNRHTNQRFGDSFLKR
eukprot:CAMPEP_0194373000 /NCGR_PEP_ID=MMETSP0174-20130528/21426_1 /TAXON_ID=216777 /ORGANISM="Proboscia alata, Strain PI-D3" /LENGTH=536 /DNA_ID=CAMNT_0039151837 /DNA_START=132 /DNA_END=1742 /DNA_ORIENTATION=-